jgi:hypothetical protein
VFQKPQNLRNDEAEENEKIQDSQSNGVLFPHENRTLDNMFIRV